MGRWDDGDRIALDIHSDLQTSLSDVRKSLGDRLMSSVEVRQIEIDELLFVRRHLLDDGPGHDVARRKILQRRRVLFHEVLPLVIAQARPLAPQRLGNQVVIRLLVGQRRGVELHVLRVHHARAGAPGHHHAVADGASGVRGMQIDLSHASRGQHRVVREDRVDVIRLVVQQVETDAFVCQTVAHLDVGRMMLCGEEVDRRHLRGQSDVRLVAHAIE